MEAAKKAGFFKTDYAALISLVLRDESLFPDDLRELKARLLQWRALRKRSAKDVQITLVGPNEANGWAKGMIVAAFEDDAELKALARDCKITVSLLNKGRTAADQFVIGG